MACIKRYHLFQTCTSKQQVSVSNDISNAQETGSNVIIGGSLVKHDIARQPSSLPTNGDTQVGVVIKRSSPIIDHRPNYGSGAGVSTGGIDGVKQPNSAIYPNMTWDDNDYVIMESTAPAESRRQYGSSTGVNLGEIDVAKQPKPITSILRIQSEIDVAKAPKSTSSTGVNVGRINDVQPRSSQGERIYGNLGPSSAQISDGNSGGFDIAQKRHEITTGWVDFGGEAPPKTPKGTDVNLDEICKEYADMMDVRKFLPKVSVLQAVVSVCLLRTLKVSKTLINLYLVQSLPTLQIILGIEGNYRYDTVDGCAHNSSCFTRRNLKSTDSATNHWQHRGIIHLNSIRNTFPLSLVIALLEADGTCTAT